MDAFEALKNRKTIRKYTTQEISKKDLEEIFTAGSWAPSIHNWQPWRFMVVHEEAKKNDIIKLLETPPDTFLTGAKIILKENAKILRQAPYVVLVFNDAKFSDRIKKVLGKDYYLTGFAGEMQSIAAAIQNICIAATTKNIGTAWFIMPIMIGGLIKTSMGDKSNYSLAAVLALGYPNESGIATKRKPLKEILSYDKPF